MLVPVFLYGGLINSAVQERVGLVAFGARHAVLRDYRITFEPWVNLRRSNASLVHGLVIDATHEMLERVYSNLAARYVPVPVLCIRDSGDGEPALCFVAPAMVPGPIDEPHVQALVEGAELWHFPADYIDEIRAFLPK